MNDEYEYYVPPDVEKPLPNEARESRQNYIIQKYVEKKFTRDKAPLTEDGQPLKMPPRQRTYREMAAAEGQINQVF